MVHGLRGQSILPLPDRVDCPILRLEASTQLFKASRSGPHFGGRLP
jgi:hypothetical protein